MRVIYFFTHTESKFCFGSNNLSYFQKNHPHDLNFLRPDQKGFTLIEVMVAMAVMVIGVLGVLYLQVATIKGNSGAMGVSRSVHEIVAGVEMAWGLDFDSTELDAGSGKTAAVLFGSTIDPLSDYFNTALSYDIVDLDATAVRNLFNYTDAFPDASGKHLVVTSTQNVSGTPKTIQLQFIKLDR